MNLMSRGPVLFSAFQRSTTLELQPCFISIHVHELRVQITLKYNMKHHPGVRSFIERKLEAVRTKGE